jgi:hypothetical protein
MTERTAEHERLRQARRDGTAWRKWGSYLSERQCHARSRAYRRGEDGIGGYSDDAVRLGFALALWNCRDPLLKERFLRLTDSEGNHGEDLKEYYFYLDATPTHSYQKPLYKYPQAEFPYADLVHNGISCGRTDREYELLDSGVFERPVLRRAPGVRQGDSGRHPDPGERDQAPRRAHRTPSPAASLVSEHLPPRGAEAATATEEEP